MSACVAATAYGQGFKPDASYYGVGFWTPDTLGNHRAIVHVATNDEVVEAMIPWRRHDTDIASKEIVILDAATGKRIDNMVLASPDKSEGRILFQPATVPGDYYIYYMAYKTSGGPYPRITYAKTPSKAGQAWVNKAMTQAKRPTQATFMGFESLSTFDSFYPMEIAATDAEKQTLLNANAGKNFILFPESREFPIRMFHDLPYRWTTKGATGQFAAEADQNEYFVYQIGVWAARKEVNNIKITFTDLRSDNGSIPASAMTCFNTGGNDWLQRPMTVSCNAKKGDVQPLWIGIQMPTGLRAGVYKGTATVQADGEQAQTIDVVINLSDYVLEDKGDSDIYRLSRLRWLNSGLELNDDIVKPFTPLAVNNTSNGTEIACLGRKVTINEYGLPAFIDSYFTEEVATIGDKVTNVINGPVKFVIEQDGKEVKLNKTNSNSGSTGGAAVWTNQFKAGNLDVNLQGRMEFDGVIEYTVKVKAAAATEVSDIRLEMPVNGDIAKYWLGMGQKGSTVPDSYEWKWDVTKAQEGYWIGDVNAGVNLVFRDENYVRPLNTNFYQSKPLVIPESWNNGGKGGISFSRGTADAMVKENTSGGIRTANKKNMPVMNVKTYSGSRNLKAGEELTFVFRICVTPFKPIDTEKQWADRYYHRYEPIDSIVAQGANTINIHHGTAINPYINYPFIRPDFMKAYIDQAHEKGCKVKIYYTVRELANRCPELWTLRSLGHEVFSAGKGGGYSWLQEHLQDDYIGAWFVDQYKDAAIITSGVSRWHNYYVEGLQWLTQNVGIDGLYIDDLAIDRTTMKRVRRVLEKNCTEPRIDLHSANQFNKGDGFINSACLYMEHMPYLDRLWLGEYFDYSAKPDYWMTEVSGIPFGMMGEMLQDDGNPYRGMLYGMTARQHYHGKDATLMPARLWKVWDDFGIKGSRMIGYWVSYNPVKTNNKDVLATCFVKDGKTMIALASWADAEVSVKLDIDWKQLGLKSSSATLTAPAIEEFQSAMTLKPGDKFTVAPGKGYIFILQ